MKIRNCDLGYIYPSALRFLGLILYGIIMTLVMFFYDSVLHYFQNFIFSKFSLIYLFLNIPIIFYKTGILINNETLEYKKYIDFIGLQIGYWEKIPKLEYFSITSTNKYVLKYTYETNKISYTDVRLYGILNNKERLMFKDYNFSRCLDVAIFFRESGINIPIYDLTGREEVEY